MELDLVFLGTGGSVPTARRATACVLVRRGGDRLLFDCGEGAQRQMQRSTGLVPIDDIYITHLHADHYLGLPGLLKTYDLTGRKVPLRIFGPPGLLELMAALGRIFGRISYPLEVGELSAGEAIPYDGYDVQPFAVEHRMPANGYAVVELPRPGRFDPQAAESLGVSAGPDFGRLQAGEAVPGAAGLIEPAQVLGPERPGRKVVITGDTRACDMTRIAAHEAQVLVHDASFADEEAERAAETGHATARDAAALARDAAVQMLALVHVSSRYDVREVLAEAHEEFAAAIVPRDFDVVEVPVPERGGPRLIDRGARPARPREIAST